MREGSRAVEKIAMSYETFLHGAVRHRPGGEGEAADVLHHTFPVSMSLLKSRVAVPASKPA